VRPKTINVASFEEEPVIQRTLKQSQWKPFLELMHQPVSVFSSDRPGSRGQEGVGRGHRLA